MANWKYTLDLSGFYHDDETPIEEKGRRVAKVIRRTFPAKWFDFSDDDNYDDEITTIVERFENITGYDNVSPTEEFDDAMDELYDFCDMEV